MDGERVELFAGVKLSTLTYNLSTYVLKMPAVIESISVFEIVKTFSPNIHWM
jgi:hypothetical protein